jgi:hypothetical protein
LKYTNANQNTMEKPSHSLSLWSRPLHHNRIVLYENRVLDFVNCQLTYSHLYYVRLFTQSIRPQAKVIYLLPSTCVFGDQSLIFFNPLLQVTILSTYIVNSKITYVTSAILDPSLKGTQHLKSSHSKRSPTTNQHALISRLKNNQ